jgi:tetratricopeptide (TPR) repeat protein
MPKDTPSIFSVSPYAGSVAREMYPGQVGQDDRQDAARHMLAAGTMARKYGPKVADLAGKAHEYSTSPMRALMMMLGRGEMPPDYQQDMHNNALGIEMAGRAKSQREFEDLVQQAAERAAMSRTEGRPWISKAKGGEVSADELNRPFIGYRSAGRRPESQQDRRASADAPLSALRGYVAGTLGLPGDIEGIGRMLIPGVSNQSYLPDSEYFRNVLPMRELEQTPIGRAFTEAGGLAGGSGLMTAGKVVGKGGKAGARYAGEQLNRAILDSSGPLARLVPEAAKPMYVVKPKGGNFLAGTVERVVEPMKTRVVGSDPAQRLRDLDAAYAQNVEAGVAMDPDVFARERARLEPEAAMNRWLDTKLGKYMRNEMATPEDPLRALAERGVLHYDPTPTGYSVSGQRIAAGFPEEGMAQSDLAKRWEKRADTFFNELQASDLTKGYPEQIETNPWLLKVPPETRVYELLGGANEELGMQHLVDELRNAVNPESGLPANLRLKYQDLEKVTVPQAVERVAKINDWRAAQKAEADAARAMNPATQVVKEYPDQGYKWVELRQPKDLPEGWTEKNGAYYDPQGERHVHPGTESLADALKYEGETMGHCVGGYCPDVVEGRSKIYSLRDKKGQPHVTIEVRPGRKLTEKDMPDDVREMLSEQYGDASREEFEAAVQLYLKQQAVPDQIVQIKGKGNKAPKEDYLPAVQDFVRSQNWGRVGDLQNTGLIDIQDPNAVLRALGKVSPERNIQQAIDNFNTAVDSAPNAQRYMSLDEMRDFLGGPSPEGFASGGLVDGANFHTGDFDPARIGSIVDELHALNAG